MNSFKKIEELSVDTLLVEFIEREVLPGLTIEPKVFWAKFSELIHQFGPSNRQLLAQREAFQKQIDAWLISHKESFNPDDYGRFLKDIGYIQPSPESFSIETKELDDEISKQAGPQLVVPVSNARFALNATNARWGSLYDALYGTDAILPKSTEKAGYDQIRGQKVINYGRDFLDKYFPLVESSQMGRSRSCSHHNITAYYIDQNGLSAITDSGGKALRLKDPSQCLGYKGEKDQPDFIVLHHNLLRVILYIDKTSSIGKSDKAGINDIVLESALTTIQDFEDSVAAVDTQDKVHVYRNWLGLMKGTLKESFEKSGKKIHRSSSKDIDYTGIDGAHKILPGRSLLLCRNVGLLMKHPAILDNTGSEVQEGIMDAMISVLIALHDVCNDDNLNSKNRNIYIVKPKLHGPDEVAWTCHLMDFIEQALSLKTNTIKLGIMDEERRTTLNLKACIHAAADRVFFINTGFLDRTGDEIHTHFHLGPAVPKADMKSQTWFDAYEKWNVCVGMQCGFKGRAQIGKGMWPKPDNMADMLKIKQEHPISGANTAWVPSPTAATLHALHYHQINIKKVQEEKRKASETFRQEDFLQQLNTVPCMASLAKESLTENKILNELNNNVQSILGYVVRWIDQGIGCSKVPNIDQVPLMEDRATLRISSQHIANWLEFGVCTEQQVRDVFVKMAKVVDFQNQFDEEYQPMTPDLENNAAFKAALDLVFQGKNQPSGYTEPLLHQYRLQKKL